MEGLGVVEPADEAGVAAEGDDGVLLDAEVHIRPSRGGAPRCKLGPWSILTGVGDGQKKALGNVRP